MSHLRIFIILIFCCHLAILQAQQPIGDYQDLKVGLVFSGGGAKCLAAIGALRVIEESGVKIDYVSGTSMGAIIGAMYSLGYSVDEIEYHMKRVDWDALLSNTIPRNRLNYHERKSDSRYLISFPIIDGGPTLPTGLNYAQYILKELSYLTQKSYLYDDFSEFPIPFLCVATNLETGELEVFEDGRLIDALRASSAFPSLFTPYEINGKLYVDGGVANNFPVTPLKDKGMDIIIAIDAQSLLYTKEELNSVVRILEQTSSFASVQKYFNQLDSVDIWIRPELTDVGMTTFDLFDTITSRGEDAAWERYRKLMDLARKDTSKPIDRKNINATPFTKFFLKEIRIEGNINSTDDYILSKIRLSAGDSCTSLQLNRSLDLLYGNRYFEMADYALQEADTGYILVLNVKEDLSLSKFQLGVHYDDDLKTAILLNYTRRNLLLQNSRFSFDVAISEYPRVLLNYSVDRGLRPTLGVKFRSHRFETRIYNNLRPVNELVYLDYSFDLYVQSVVLESFAFGGGLQLEGIDLSKSLDVIGPIDMNNDYINYYGFVDLDSYNDSEFPTSGTQFNAMYRIIARHENLSAFYKPSSVVNAAYSQVIPVTSEFTVIGELFGASTIGPDLPYQYNIFLGSMGRNYINYIYPFIGYRFMELIGRNAVVFRGNVHYEFYKNHYFLLRGNVGKLEQSIENIFGSDVLLDGYSLGYSFNSPLGPLEFNIMSSTNHSNIYTYIRLGFWF